MIVSGYKEIILSNMDAKYNNIDDLNRIVEHNTYASAGLSTSSSIAILVTATLFFAYHFFSEYSVHANDLSEILLEASVLVLLLTVLVDEFIKHSHFKAIASYNSYERNALKKHFINGVNHQFDIWALTANEKKVASLLLKGMSTSVIALALGKNEHVIEQRTIDIYRKAGVKNRNELSSYFINELLT